MYVTYEVENYMDYFKVYYDIGTRKVAVNIFNLDDNIFKTLCDIIPVMHDNNITFLDHLMINKQTNISITLLDKQ